MEQKITPYDILLVQNIVRLAQERLNMSITQLTNGEVNIEADIATQIQQDEMAKKELFDKGVEVLKKFGLA